jgi:N-acetylmuramoyl-L-alanine amidase
MLAACANQRQRPHLGDWQSEELIAAAPPPSVAPTPAAAPAEPLVTAEKPPALKIFPETWVSLNRWCKANGLAAPSLLSKGPATFAVTTGPAVLVVRIGSQMAQCDGLELRLGFAPQLTNGEPHVHTLDLQKTIAPLIISPMPMAARDQQRQPIIVLDPGHGGDDPGTQSVLGRASEKDYTLDWALRLEALLVTNGWSVFLTRTNDHELSLSNRVAFAQSCKADLFVSLHFNSAAPNDAEAGLETYCLTPAGMPSTVTRGFADDPRLVFPNNAFDPQNVQFAVRIHRALLQVNGRLDRGVRRARYLGVLRGQQRPAILIEGGYLSNAREAGLIDSSAYRQKLAAAIANALAVPPGPGGTNATLEPAPAKTVDADTASLPRE